MASKTKLTFELIKKQVANLRKQFEKERRKSEAAETEGKRINDEIRALQDQCPHSKAQDHPFMDGLGVKWRKICTACGAQC